MTFTYDPLDMDPKVSQVRLKIGDTTTPGHLLEDEEIEFLLSENADNVSAASLAAARAMLPKVAKEVDKTVGDLRIRWSQWFRNLLRAIEQLEQATIATNPAEVYVGGRLVAEADTDAADTSLTQPQFKIGIHDLPGSSNLRPLRDDI